MRVSPLTTVPHENGAQSVHRMVDELREEEEEEEDNPVLCYKSHGTSDPTLYQLHKESFMLRISSVLAQPHSSQ